MRKVIYLLLCLLLPLTSMAKGEDELKYDLAAAGVGAEGTTLVKVSVYVSKAKNATADLLRLAAVHGIIFRGLSETGSTGYAKQQALAEAGAEEQWADYFAAFFATGGDYTRYASMVGGITEMTKIEKQYRATAVVSVSTDALKKALREAGVIKGMTDGF